MENLTRKREQTQINGPDSASSREIHDHELESHHSLLLSKSMAMEESLNLLRQERDEAVARKAELVKVVDEISYEKDSLWDRINGFEATLMEKEDDFAYKFEQVAKEKEGIKKELEIYKERIEKLEAARRESNEILFKFLDSLRSAKESLDRIVEEVEEVEEEEKIGDEDFAKEGEDIFKGLELNEEMKAIWEEIMAVSGLAAMAELMVIRYKEARKKEKRELGNSLVSLTEENRDINSLLRVALLEKEAVEKSLSRLKGNSEQKRVALLQMAERSLLRVGFGFMMGSGNQEQSLETVAKVDASGAKSDGSECEEEVVSLASTVERIMKNLRLEITQLRKSLEESRSDTERLQSLTQKQAKNIAENNLYIKELEDRERALAQNVEELLMEIKETEADVARWREACELEVEAGKNEIAERDKLMAILKQELEKTKVALDLSNGKLKLKEELAAAAMAAQAAAEKSLQLADSRAAGLRERIEELSKQLEEAESRERKSRRVRHICWPWRALKLNVANNPNNRVSSLTMEALLYYNV